MTYSWDFANTAAGRVLKAIQFRGRARVQDVADDLGVTPSAVRQHLSQLQASGAIQADKVREGVGRPYYLYSVTPDAHNLFYRDYGDLARLLLEELARNQGPEALQGVLRRISGRLAEVYRDEIGGQELADRVRDWAEILDRRGIAVEVEQTEDGYLIQEYGCPYQNVAVENRAVCEMERQVMAYLLESGVKLTQCVLDGHHGCRFTVLKDRD
ncbi:MAG: ArsR family transcriptional regulator [Anaerolineae bacterium]|jgi:predicted ArsR family transcriptional regulator